MQARIGSLRPPADPCNKVPLHPNPLYRPAFMAQTRAVRGNSAACGRFLRGAAPEPRNAKPAESEAAGLHPEVIRENLYSLAGRRIPQIAEFGKPFWRAPVKCTQNQSLPAGCAAPGGPMLAY